MDVRRIRADFPALKHYTWFQNGGVSITPVPVAEELDRHLQELLDRGPMHIVYPGEEAPRRERTIQRLARFFSAEPEELALMRGVSEAYQTVLRGLDWKSGDQIMISDDEEAALLLPTLHLRDLCGIEVVKLPLIDDQNGQIAAATQQFTSRTRFVALSHVTTDIGHRLPVREICAAARERGILTFVDLAQSAGLYAIALPALGCDFAGILSYKWMYGPYATGMLWVRRGQLNALQVRYAGGRAEEFLNFETDTYELHESAARFQYGPWSWPLVHAWACAADYLSGIGLDEIWQRTISLTQRLKRGLNAIPNCTLYTPESPDRSAAMVSFGLAGWTGAELCSSLRARWAIVAKALPQRRDGLRVSVTFFHLEEEIDRLLDAVRTLAAERPAT